jgi:EAL domain-containing protein (putative c-di-GMP-specific phosphodiesterase class I)
LCDNEGEVLWLSEGALGPDEHGFVIEAIGRLTADLALPHCEFDLEDGRYGVFLPVRSPQADLVALVMILAETKGLGSGIGARILTPQVRLILQKIAIHLRPQAAMAVVPPIPAAPPPAMSAPAANSANSASKPKNTGNGAGNRAHPAKPTNPGPSAQNGHAKSQQQKPVNTAANVSSPPAAAAPQRAPLNSQTPNVSNTAHPSPPTRAATTAQPDFGSVTSVLSPLAVDDILSFELVDDEADSPLQPMQEDPALALSPDSEELEDHFDIGELALEDEPVVLASRGPAENPPKSDAPKTDALKKVSAPAAPAGFVPPMDLPVLGAPPVVARAAAPVEPAAKKPEPASEQPAPVLSPTDVAIKALREPSNAYAAMRYGAIPVEKPTLPAVAPRPPTPAPKLNSYVDPAFKDLALSVQLLSKLRPGGRTKRYEVLLRNKQNPKALVAADEIIRSLDEKSDLDGFVVSQLLTWLAENPKASERESLTFSINLSSRALYDERFPDFVASWLRKTGIAAESIGFELAETDCVQHKEHAARFVTACEKLGCFIVIDDFTMESRALEFLRSKALKLVKLDPRLTNEAMKDKLSQALVIAISQAAKVLGVHCAAKKIESQMVRRWITAIGFDFAQGTLFEGPQHVDDLLLPPAR